MNIDKKKAKFSIVDLVIVLLLLGMAFLMLKYFVFDSLFDEGENVGVTYEIRLQNIKSEMTNHIKYGDSVYDGVYGEHIGKVEKVRTEQHTEAVYNNTTGQYNNAVKSGYYDVYITVVCDAVSTSDTYYVADVELRVGEPMSVRLPDFCGSGYLIDVRLTGAEG